MQQEQWERDGAYANVYDRELRPLQVLGDDSTDKAKKKSGDGDDAEEWPLRSAASTIATQPEGESETDKPRSDAGYKTVPTVSVFKFLYSLLLLLALSWMVATGAVKL
jgi:hypothetical protein